VGGRLLKFDKNGVISYISPALNGICNLKVGTLADPEQIKKVAEMLAQALEMAAGLRQRTQLLDKLWTQEAGAVWNVPTEKCVISFSGGVADCIETEHPWLTFGDLGPLLGEAIRESALCRGAYRLGQETIRATVIGVGCHATQLSGSTVFYRDVTLPLKNLPVVALRAADLEDANAIRHRLQQQDGMAVLALPAMPGVGYGKLRSLAQVLSEAVTEQELLVAAETDMAKALGQALALRTDRPILCIDRVKLRQGDYLDVAPPVGLAFPVVVKTLVLGG
jgi:ethanolamine utilization protein EutA